MPQFNCPLPDCTYKTDDVNDAVAAALLNIHVLVHTQPARPAVTKQKPPKIDRPILSRGSSEEEWDTFLKKWELFKNGTDIPNGQINTQLWQCCDKDLESDLLKDVRNFTTITEEDLLLVIKKLSVISVAASVRRTELLSLRQDHGQPIRSFAAQVKGKAQICSFNKACTAATCREIVDYTEDMVKYVIISGIVNEEIKKDVLSQEGLDDKSLNDTISLIENKEMAVRAMSPSKTFDGGISVTAANSSYKNSKDVQAKLAIRTPCKVCNTPFQKFKLFGHGRNSKQTLREFSECVDCWKKLKGGKKADGSTNALFDQIYNNSALFDVQRGDMSIDNISAMSQIMLSHQIFDGTCGWMTAESKKQPTLQLRLTMNPVDYIHLDCPFPKGIHQSKLVTAITDTGAQSSLMGLKVYLSCGLLQESLLPVKRKMVAANNEGINIIGAFFARLSGADRNGTQIECAEMIYVSDSTEVFYLSRNALEHLQVIGTDFPRIGAASQASVTLTNPPSKTSDQTTSKAPCGCLQRQLPPPRPTKLPFDATEANNDKMKHWLLERYAASTFNKCPHQPLPMMDGPPIKLHVDPAATPVAIHTPAHIPIHWRDEIKEQLDADVKLGVIDKIEPNTPSVWCHRALWTRKPDGSPRRVIDFQALNRHAIRDTHHTVPPFQQARLIPPETYRSVTDAWNGYHSVSVCEEDRHLLSFITEYGRYQYRVAPQGFLASGDGYTHRYDKIIADVPRKTKCVDDTVLWDESLHDHYWRMIDYLELVGSKGVILNPSKFQFAQNEIDFAGFRISSNEVTPLPKYLDSIRSFPKPTRIADIRAWFGLVNQVSHYSKLTTMMAPFRPLLSPKTPFIWTPELDDAFERSKEEIIKAIVHGVTIFDPSRKTCLNTDWSKITPGIGYWLRQKYCECDSELPNCCQNGWKITLAGSRFLRGSEIRYAPIEGEALAISWALNDTKYFTLGCDDLVVATDHKPLTRIFNDRLLGDISNERILQLKQRTLMWRFKIMHLPGTSMPAADALSRNPSNIGSECFLDGSNEYCGDETSIFAIHVSAVNKVQAVTWEHVRTETTGDPYMKQLKGFILDGFPDTREQLPVQLQSYWRYRDNLFVFDEVIMLGDRIVIPPNLRSAICESLHSAHQGTTGMSERAKVSVFWPGITNSINDERDRCNTCWTITPSQQSLPPVQPLIPTSPFEAIAADYCSLEGNHYLIIVDRFSNWPEVIQVRPGTINSGSSGLVKALKRNFATFGVPQELSSDGGPEFKADKTEDFLKRWGVTHRLSSVAHPQSNGRAEIAVKSMKRLLRENVSPNGEIDTDGYTRAILQFRNTPDPLNGLSPAQIVFGRTLKDVLPVKPQTQVFTNDLVRPAWKELWSSREATLHSRSIKQFENLSAKCRSLPPLKEGDVCRVQNQTGRFPKRWDKIGQVVQVATHDQYILRLNGSRRLTLRNRQYIRKIDSKCVSDNDCVFQPPPSTDHSVKKSCFTVSPPNVSNHLPNSSDENISPAIEPSVTIDRCQLPPAQPTVEEQSLPEYAETSESNTEGEVPLMPDVPHKKPQRDKRPPIWHQDYKVG